MTEQADKDIHDIIDAGRRRETISTPVRPFFLLCGLSLVLLWLSFTPMQWAPLAWIALVPLCLLLRAPRMATRHYLVVTGCAWIWAASTLQWMRLGHPMMYFGLVALSFYVSLYIASFVAVSRRLLARNHPLWLVAPLVWTALEFARAHLLTGFPWYFVGHTQYRWTELVQIADIAGVAGITFIVVMSSAALAQCVPVSLFTRIGFSEITGIADCSNRQRWTGVIACLVLVLASVTYGWQRQQPTTATEGPVIALVQGHFPPGEKNDMSHFRTMTNTHDLLTARAAQEQPDLIVWPESMWPWPDWIVHPDVTDSELIAMVAGGRSVTPETADEIVARWHSTETREALSNRSQVYGTSILFGLITHVAGPDGLKRYNSAAFVRPDLGYIGRFDKIHRVVFGEYVPLESVFPFLATVVPYSSRIDEGVTPKVFESGSYRYAPIICFEDTIPRLVRRIINSEPQDEEKPDVLVNLTNDGWFRGSSELDQHLIAATFRCIETRRPMVRAVNGGISALIDSSGRIREPERMLIMTSSGGYEGEFKEVDAMIDPQTGQWYRECSAVMTGQIPIDGRNTIWLQIGDWLAMLCCAITLSLSIRSFFKHNTAKPAAGG